VLAGRSATRETTSPTQASEQHRAITTAGRKRMLITVAGRCHRRATVASQPLDNAVMGARHGMVTGRCGRVVTRPAVAGL
jgi:hypothetical protein